MKTVFGLVLTAKNGHPIYRQGAFNETQSYCAIYVLFAHTTDHLYVYVGILENIKQLPAVYCQILRLSSFSPTVQSGE